MPACLLYYYYIFPKIVCAAKRSDDQGPQSTSLSQTSLRTACITQTGGHRFIWLTAKTNIVHTKQNNRDYTHKTKRMNESTMMENSSRGAFIAVEPMAMFSWLEPIMRQWVSCWFPMKAAAAARVLILTIDLFLSPAFASEMATRWCHRSKQRYTSRFGIRHYFIPYHLQE